MMTTLNNRVEAMANEAVFVLQFNTRDAVRYVQRNAHTDEPTAQKAIKTVTTFHKKARDPWRTVTV
jgi:hypothetical protein